MRERVCNDKRMIKIITLALVIFLMGCGQSTDEIGLLTYEEADSSTSHELLQMDESTEEIEGTEEELVSVYICGAVISPGVYEFEVGNRVTHAVDEAGGFASDAESQYWNLAQILTDGEKIYVPTKKEVESGFDGGVNPSSLNEDDGKININTASKEQLMTLTGVGEAKALSIISYRENNGNYSAIEDVMKISGIKDAVFNTIKDYIKV